MMFKDNSEGSLSNLRTAKADWLLLWKVRQWMLRLLIIYVCWQAILQWCLSIFGYIQSKDIYVSSDDLVCLKVIAKGKFQSIWLLWVGTIVEGPMKVWSKFYLTKENWMKFIPLHIKCNINMAECHELSSTWEFKRRDGYSGTSACLNRGRKLYWNYANNEFFDNGFDAWWCDASREPLDADWTLWRMVMERIIIGNVGS